MSCVRKKMVQTMCFLQQDRDSVGQGRPAVQWQEEAGPARQDHRLPQGNPQDQGH